MFSIPHLYILNLILFEGHRFLHYFLLKEKHVYIFFVDLKKVTQ